MADNEQSEERGPQTLKEHLLAHKIEVAMWITRILTTLFTIGYFIPLFW